MIPVDYRRATSAEEAIRLAGQNGARLLGGGTNLVDLMRKGVESPSRLIDVTGLSALVEATRRRADDRRRRPQQRRRGAPLVRARYPILSRAILAGASAQIRNMATVGGNLMQRTRCLYFNDVAGSRCNKREPGSGCDAQGGFNRYNAILGGSEACVATHPSDMCVALAALDARVRIRGTKGERSVPVAEFHRLPGDQPDIETALEPGEAIVAVELPPSSFADRSAYRKVRDRASYAFALVSVAAAISLSDGRIEDVRIALGGVAPRPWRAYRAEAALRGASPAQEAFAAAAAAELESAEPLAHNAFKVGLTTRTLAAVLSEISGDDR